MTEKTDTDFLKLEIRKSNIEGAGEGVFVTKALKEGEIICEYRGEAIPHTGEKKDEPHSLTNKDLDAGNHTIRGNSIASKVNDLINFTKYNMSDMLLLVAHGELKRTRINDKVLSYNCVYRGFFDKTFIVALRDIEVGEELYVEYGIKYWFKRLVDEGLINFK